MATKYKNNRIKQPQFNLDRRNSKFAHIWRVLLPTFRSWETRKCLPNVLQW